MFIIQKVKSFNRRQFIILMTLFFLSLFSVSAIAQPTDEIQSNNIFNIIGIALLGGLILNIMPCVLPVLGMKLSNMLALSSTNSQSIRLQFLASASGILVSFWLLAFSVLILRITGGMIGWGIQYQNPLFIGFMAITMGLFTANLLGLFEIQLSHRFSTFIAQKGDNSIL
ncbi:hypothetical protein [Aliivibrio fischeri]|nr:hypothetical protein [Aliivibrio fischeri]